MTQNKETDWVEETQRLMFALYHEPFPEYEWTEQKIKEIDDQAYRKGRESMRLEVVNLISTYSCVGGGCVASDSHMEGYNEAIAEVVTAVREIPIEGEKK